MFHFLVWQPFNQLCFTEIKFVISFSGKKLQELWGCTPGGLRVPPKMGFKKVWDKFIGKFLGLVVSRLSRGILRTAVRPVHAESENAESTEYR